MNIYLSLLHCIISSTLSVFSYFLFVNLFIWQIAQKTYLFLYLNILSENQYKSQLNPLMFGNTTSNYTTEHNKKPEMSNSATLNNRQENTRIFQREVLDQSFCRKITIPLKYVKPDSKILNAKEAELALSEKRKLEQQYLFQVNPKSYFVIRNLLKWYEGFNLVWFQEDYHCLLSDFPLHTLSFKTRIQIFYCIAHGVYDISSQFICHRQLCPKNIAIIKQNSGQIIAKINCFEEAIVLDDSREIIQNPLGNINSFSSPEIRKGKPHGLSTDIWSLGYLLNFILYETTQNISVERGHVQIELPKGTSDWLVEMLKSMIHIDPSKRYSLKTIMDILKVSFKCIEMLDKIVPVGKDKITEKMKRRGSG